MPCILFIYLFKEYCKKYKCITIIISHSVLFYIFLIFHPPLKSAKINVAMEIFKNSNF